MSREKKPKDSRLLIWLKEGYNAIKLLTSLGLLAFLINHYQDQYNSIRDHLNNIDKEIYNVSILDQNAYNYCEAYVLPIAKHKQFSDAQLKEMGDQNREIGKAVSVLANDIKSIGALLSFESYRKLKEFNCWNNQLISSKKPICYSGLKDGDQIDQWRNNIATNIQ